MKIFIGGLPKDITDKDLYDAFEDFGIVTSAKVITDKKTGISRSYGFVEMPDEEQAHRAIEALHEAVVDGQTVSVKVGVDPEPPAPKKKGKAPTVKPKFKKPVKTVAKIVEPRYSQFSTPAPMAPPMPPEPIMRTGGKRKRNAGYKPNNQAETGS